MKIDLLTDFESVIETVSEVSFFAGYLTGFLIVAFVLFLIR